MTILLAIDPSVTCSGWAVFEDGRLVDAGILRAKNLSDAAKKINEFMQTRNRFAETIAYELPQIYRGAQSKADPADIIKIAAVAGMWLVFCDDCSTGYSPHEWKGNVKKEVIHSRIHDRLDAHESERLRLCLKEVPASLQHNAMDAVGIGLKELGRFEKKRGALE